VRCWGLSQPARIKTPTNKAAMAVLVVKRRRKTAMGSLNAVVMHVVSLTEITQS